MRLALESLHRVKQVTLSRWVSLLQSTEVLNRTKTGGKGEWLSLLDCFHNGTSTFRLILGLNTIHFSGSQPFRLNTSSPGPPAGRWQTVGYLSLHNRANSIYMYLLLVCFSGESNTLLSLKLFVTSQ